MQLTKDSSVPAALYVCIRLAWVRVGHVLLCCEQTSGLIRK